MDFDTVVKSVGHQIKVAWDAPVPFLVCVAIVAFLIWRAMEWRYGGIIENLRARVEHLESGATVDTHSVAAAPAPVAAPAVRAEPKGPDLNHLIYETIRNARRAVADNRSIRTAEKKLPDVTAMLLTLKKEKGITSPKPTGDARLDLEAGCRILEEIAPLLRQGHDEEARQAAAAFTKQCDG